MMIVSKAGPRGLRLSGRPMLLLLLCILPIHSSIHIAAVLSGRRPAILASNLAGIAERRVRHGVRSGIAGRLSLCSQHRASIFFHVN